MLFATASDITLFCDPSYKLFLFLTFVSLIIYVYFFMRNYSDYQKYKNKSYEVRLFGSILVLVASICFIYFQLTTRTEDSPSIA